MAEFVCLHSKDDVERFCRKNPILHLYTLGDLDDFFWPHTTWYALRDAGEVRQLVLCYTALKLPTGINDAKGKKLLSNGQLQTQPFDESIQPGDGTWGFPSTTRRVPVTDARPES